VKTIKVLVIDDSAYSRRTITKMLDELPEVEVIGYASNGEEGIRRIVDLKPDLVTLDLEMPVMDGFTLLRIIMNSCPIPIIVISARNDDERVFKALELGAVDFIAKPGGAISVELINIREDLQNKVRSILSLNMETIRRRGSIDPAVKTTDVRTPLVARRIGAKSSVDLVAIGASTGGPPALQKIFTDFPQELPFAVLVSQHMPSGFTKAFADRLNRLCPFPIKESADGDTVVAGQVYVAPGGFNMLVELVNGESVIRLVEPSARDRYVPSVDAMFESVAALYGQRVLAVVLTGMGNDGSRGVKAVKAGGGQVFAEAEESAIVFGMPREAIATNLVDKIVPLDAVADEIMLATGNVRS
jgi:two-component system chemotaxis response regulator CheB